MNPIVITCPTEGEILERNADVLASGSDVERAVKRFAKQLGSTPKNAHGVTLAWAFIVHDLCNAPGAMPLLFGVLDWVFDDVIQNTFADNPDFMAQIKEVREAVKAKVGE